MYKLLVMYANALGGGGGGEGSDQTRPPTPPFFKTNFVILPNMTKYLEGGVKMKNLKSSFWDLGKHFTRKDIFLCVFRQPFFSLKPLDDVINCDVII